MDGIMQYVMETYNFLIQKTSDGKQFAYDDLIDSLELTPQEKSFVRLTFRTNGVEIINREKEVVQKEDRSREVRDFNYGYVQSHNLESVDKPVLAKIVYEGKELVFEDYSALDDFIINEFIPDNVYMKVNKSRNSRMGVKLFGEKEPVNELDGSISNDSRDSYPSIMLGDIVKLRLSEKEIMHVVETLRNEGIRVGGTSMDMDSEFINYDYIRTYVSKRYDKPLTALEEKEKFTEYNRTHDPVLREELIVRNLRLVPFIAWKLALLHNINQEELESFGYEGLMYAIDKYDPIINYRFSTYAIPCITGFIRNSIPKLKNVSSNIYYGFQNVRYIVEKEWGQKFDGNPVMLDEIIDVMVEEGIINEKARDDIKRSFISQISYDELKEENVDISESEFDSHLDGKYYFNLVKGMLDTFLKTLQPREQRILSLRYGLDDGRQRTLDEVGKEFQITRDRVKQVEDKALRKMRRRMRGYIEIGSSDMDLSNSNGVLTLYDNNEEDIKKL